MVYGYEDWARTRSVTQAELLREYRKHGLTHQDLLKDLGDHPEYEGADVLDALGY